MFNFKPAGVAAPAPAAGGFTLGAPAVPAAGAFGANVLPLGGAIGGGAMMIRPAAPPADGAPRPNRVNVANAASNAPREQKRNMQRMKDLLSRAQDLTSGSPTASLKPSKLKRTVVQLKAACDQQGANIRGKKRGVGGAVRPTSNADLQQGARRIFARFDGGHDRLQRDYDALDLKMKAGGVFVESDGADADVATFIKRHSEHLFELTLEEALDGTLDSSADRLNDLLYVEWEHDKMLALEHMPQGRLWAGPAATAAAAAIGGGGGPPGGPPFFGGGGFPGGVGVGAPPGGGPPGPPGFGGGGGGGGGAAAAAAVAGFVVPGAPGAHVRRAPPAWWRTTAKAASRRQEVDGCPPANDANTLITGFAKAGEMCERPSKSFLPSTASLPTPVAGAPRPPTVDTASAVRANCAAAVMELNRKGHKGNQFGFATVMKHAINATVWSDDVAPWEEAATLEGPWSEEEKQREIRTQLGAQSLSECWELICHILGEEQGVGRFGAPDAGEPWRVVALPFAVAPGATVQVTRTLRDASMLHGARKLLEKQYRNFINDEMTGVEDEDQMGVVDDGLGISSIRKFLSVFVGPRLAGGRVKWDRWTRETYYGGSIDGVPLWPYVYFCLRCGLVAEAGQLLERVNKRSNALNPNKGGMQVQESKVVKAMRLLGEHHHAIKPLSELRSANFAGGSKAAAPFSTSTSMRVVDENVYKELSEQQLAEKVAEIAEGEGVLTEAQLDHLDDELRQLEEAYDPYREAVLRLLGGGGAEEASADPPRAFGIFEHIIEDFVWFKLVTILNSVEIAYAGTASAFGAAGAAAASDSTLVDGRAELVRTLREHEGEFGREPLKLVTLLLLTLEFERAIDFLARNAVGVGGSGGRDVVGGIGAEGMGAAAAHRSFDVGNAHAIDPAFLDALHIAIALFQYGVLRTDVSSVQQGAGYESEARVSEEGPGFRWELWQRTISSGGLLVDNEAPPGEAVLRFTVMLRKYVLYLASESRAAFEEVRRPNATGQERQDAVAVSIHMARTAVEYACVLKLRTAVEYAEAERTLHEQALENLLVELVLSLKAGSPALQDLLWGSVKGTWENAPSVLMPQNTTAGGLLNSDTSEGYLRTGLGAAPEKRALLERVLHTAAIEAKKIGQFALALQLYMALSWNQVDPLKRTMDADALVLIIEQLSKKLVLPEVVAFAKNPTGRVTPAQEMKLRDAIDDREQWKWAAFKSSSLKIDPRLADHIATLGHLFHLSLFFDLVYVMSFVVVARVCIFAGSAFTSLSAHLFLRLALVRPPLPPSLPLPPAATTAPRTCTLHSAP